MFTDFICIYYLLKNNFAKTGYFFLECELDSAFEGSQSTAATLTASAKINVGYAI